MGDREMTTNKTFFVEAGLGDGSGFARRMRARSARELRAKLRKEFKGYGELRITEVPYAFTPNQIKETERAVNRYEREQLNGLAFPGVNDGDDFEAGIRDDVRQLRRFVRAMKKKNGAVCACERIDWMWDTALSDVLPDSVHDVMERYLETR
jgi:hypothetical protein